MAFTWPVLHYVEALTPAQLAAREVLRVFFEAFQAGDYSRLHPDPFRPISNVSKIIERLDAGFEEEWHANWMRTVEKEEGVTGPPRFSLLPPPQQLALCQQLAATLKRGGAS